MDPVFTLPYSEYAVVNNFLKHFKPKKGYSIYVPISRQEKGIDLLLAKRIKNELKTLTIQVKASRTYCPEKPKRESTAKRFSFDTWFNRFDIPKASADIYALVGLYPSNEDNKIKSAKNWWKILILIFAKNEMKEFMSNVLTKEGKKDRMFGFGFDSSDAVFQTRGNRAKEKEEYTGNLLENRVKDIEKMLKRGL